jgi:anaerobic sulfite reductase subunit C
VDINTKKIIKNAYRVTKERGVTALRIRVPGGRLEVEYFDIIKSIAQKFGDGTVHITTRQGLEVPGIPMAQIPEVNEALAPLLAGMEGSLGVEIADLRGGYPAAGTRNVSACIGNAVCPFACHNTTQMARKIERLIYPNDFHVKIAVTGCPNDCIKAHMQDIGVIGMVLPVYDAGRCMGCEACVKNCRKVASGALTMSNFKVKRDHARCLGCGECVLKCPTSAWTRGGEYFRLVIMGRTGKKNPRLARTFVRWVDETAVLKIIANMYGFIDKYIDRGLPKEHVGYIVDRAGLPVFREEALRDVDPGPLGQVEEHIPFGGYFNR